jgi:hypothetical protein
VHILQQGRLGMWGLKVGLSAMSAEGWFTLLPIVLRTYPCLIHRARVIIDPIVSDQKTGTQANLCRSPNTTPVQTIIISNREMGANVHGASNHVLVKVCLIHRASQVQEDIQDE